MVRATLALVCCLSAVSQAQEPPAAPLPPEPQAQPPVLEPQTPADAAATAPTPTGEPGADWSLRSGQTMGQDQSAVSGQAGWPGIQTEYIYGIRPFLDLGGRFEFDYSFLGDPDETAPGIKFQGIIRVHLFDAGKLVFSARFEPGFLAFFFSSNGVQKVRTSGVPAALRVRSPRQVEPVPIPDYSSQSFSGTTTGITLPEALEVGLPVSAVWKVNARVSVPTTIIFGDVNGTTVVPVMVGVGAEYRLQPRLSLVADLAAGPIFYSSGSDFGFHTMVGVAWKL
ncbi:MAG TPA: hypothetical protein VFN45_14430 [Myxococcaceae bacterium]|nr:hypothetical protein [Myxococcaceae bacterium]